MTRPVTSSRPEIGEAAWSPFIPPGLEDLVAQGRLRPPRMPVPPDFFELPPPPEPLPLSSREFLDSDRGD